MNTYSVSLCMSIDAENEEQAKQEFYEFITDLEFDCDGDSIDAENEEVELEED